MRSCGLPASEQSLQSRAGESHMPHELLKGARTEGAGDPLYQQLGALRPSGIGFISLQRDTILKHKPIAG